MFEKLMSLFVDKPTDEDRKLVLAFLSAVENNRICPVSELVKQHGTPTRVFNGTRVDN